MFNNGRDIKASGSWFGRSLSTNPIGLKEMDDFGIMINSITTQKVSQFRDRGSPGIFWILRKKSFSIGITMCHEERFQDQKNAIFGSIIDVKIDTCLFFRAMLNIRDLELHHSTRMSKRFKMYSLAVHLSKIRGKLYIGGHTSKKGIQGSNPSSPLMPSINSS